MHSCQSNEYDCGVIGKAVNVAADESVMVDGRIDMLLVNAIAFDSYTHGYYKVTEHVGKCLQGWTGTEDVILSEHNSASEPHRLRGAILTFSLSASMVQSPFKNLGAAGKGQDHHQVHNSDDGPCLERHESIGHHTFGAVDQLRKSDDRQDRGILQSDDELVDDTGNHHTDRLRQHHPAHSSRIGKPEGSGGLHLSDIHRLDAGPYDLRHISTAVESQTDSACLKRRKRDPELERVIQKVRNTEIDEVCQDYHGYATDAVHKDCRDDITGPALYNAEQAEDHPDDAGKKQSKQCQEQGLPHSAQKD